MLVVATSGAGYVLGSGSAIDFLGLSCTCAGTMMVAASANSLNQVCTLYLIIKLFKNQNFSIPLWGWMLRQQKSFLRVFV